MCLCSCSCFFYVLCSSSVHLYLYLFAGTVANSGIEWCLCLWCCFSVNMTALLIAYVRMDLPVCLPVCLSVWKRESFLWRYVIVILYTEKSRENEGRIPSILQCPKRISRRYNKMQLLLTGFHTTASKPTKRTCFLISNRRVIKERNWFLSVFVSCTPSVDRQAVRAFGSVLIKWN